LISVLWGIAASACRPFDVSGTPCDRAGVSLRV
jgi:hypothetical protein